MVRERSVWLLVLVVLLVPTVVFAESTATLNQPTNDTAVLAGQVIGLNVTVTGNNSAWNITLQINGISNSTLTSVPNNTRAEFNISFNPGSYNWSANSSYLALEATNFSTNFTFQAIGINIVLNQPTNNTDVLAGQLIGLNATITGSSSFYNTTLVINGVANATLSGISNNTRAEFNVSFNLGVYNWSVNASVGNASNVSVNSTFRAVEVRVALNQPTNNTDVLAGQLTGLNATITGSSSLYNATLVINGVANATLSGISNNTRAEFNVSFNPGTYTWNVNASSGNASNTSVNSTFRAVGISIVLNQPANSSSLMPNSLTGFNATFNGSSSSYNATFVLNGTPNTTISNIPNNTRIEFNISVKSGVYNWSVNATVGNASNSSLTFTFVVPLFNFSNISGTKLDTPDPVNASSNLTYQINVSSSGNGTTYNVTVNDTYPTQAIFLTSQPTAVSGTNNTFILGNLTNGTNITINITLLIQNISNSTIINNTVNITWHNETSGLLSINLSASTTIVNFEAINSSLFNATLSFSNVTNSYVANSTITRSNVSNSTVIGSTEVTNSTVTNTTFVNSTANNITVSHSLVNNTIPVANSTVSSSNVSNSTVAGSIITGSHVINSTLSNATLTSSSFFNSTILNSVVTTTRVTTGRITGSNVSTSNITNATIANSFQTIINSNITNCNVTNSTIIDSNKLDCALIIDSVITNSTNRNTSLVNVTEVNSTINGSSLGSSINTTTIRNSTFVNVTASNSNITRSTLTNCTVINSSITNMVSNNCTFTNVVLPFFNLSNISVTKSDTPDPVITQQRLNYTITVRSTGNGTAFNVTVNDTYPNGLTFLSSQPTAVSGTNNTFILGNLTAGTNITINVTLNVTGAFGSDTVINNSVNTTFQNETSGNLSVVATQSTTVSVPPVISGGSSGLGGGGGGGGAGAAQTHSMTTNALTVGLKRSDRVTFSIKNIQHVLTVMDILTNKVLIRVSSTPQDFSLTRGGVQDVDVDRDGTMDIRVIVRDITYGKTTLSIEKIGAAATACIENWNCGAWNACANGSQTRECSDANKCGTIIQKPSTKQLCGQAPKPLPPANATKTVDQAAAGPAEAMPSETAERTELPEAELMGMFGAKRTMTSLFYGLGALIVLIVVIYWITAGRKKKSF